MAQTIQGAGMLNHLIKEMSKMARLVDHFEGRCQDLELALGLDKVCNVQAAFAVSETLAQILIFLADGKGHNKENLHACLYFRRPDVEIPDVKIVDTQICKLRKHIAPHGVEIETLWSGGYKLVHGISIVHAAMQYATTNCEEAALRRKRERAREYQRRIRAERGARNRQVIEAQSLSRMQPWKAAGVSRATWFRHRETGALRTNDNSPVSDRITASLVAA